MQATCPNCSKPIDVLSAKELEDKFGIGANQLQYARDNKRFPEPWLSMPNRNLWLREDIEKYVSELGREKVDQTVKTLMRTLANLPESERKIALEELRKIG